MTLPFVCSLICYQVHGHEDDVDSVTFADASSHILISGADDGLCKVSTVQPTVTRHPWD